MRALLSAVSLTPLHSSPSSSSSNSHPIQCLLFHKSSIHFPSNHHHHHSHPLRFPLLSQRRSDQNVGRGEEEAEEVLDELLKKHGKVVYRRGGDQKQSPTADVDDDAESLSFAVALAKVASDVKAGDIRVLFVKPLVYWTRFFIIATAFSRPQIDAIGSRIRDTAEKDFKRVHSGDTKPNSWTLLDFGDVVVHIFLPQQQIMAYSSSIIPFTLVSLVLLLVLGSSSAQLTTNFYSSSCPNLFSAIKPVVQSAIATEKRMGASLLRLFFHDCFVNGCDGSLLLDDTTNFTGEKTANPNKNSVRGFDVIDKIKAAVEKACPGVVSCADILAVTARDSVVILGGPTWNVKLGRRDSKTASLSGANNNIPPPTSSLGNLISKFKAQGLSTNEMVALAGGHTIGQARCTNFRAHIYNDTDINASFATSRQSNCPSSLGSGNNTLAPLDLQTPTAFDNNYFKNLINNKGLLHSDQELFNGGSTSSQVTTYSNNPGKFSSDFVAAMIKMGDISPLTGSNGEIRKNCRKTN